MFRLHSPVPRFLAAVFSGAISILPPTSARSAESFPTSLVRLDGEGFLAPEALAAKPVILLFWDDDCAPCRLELGDLASIRASAPALQIVVVVMRVTPRARRHLRSVESEGIVLVRAPADARPMFRRLGNAAGALPFSAAYHADRSLCLTHLGRMDTSQAKKILSYCLEERLGKP